MESLAEKQDKTLREEQLAKELHNKLSGETADKTRQRARATVEKIIQEKSRRVLHEPQLDTILMVEKAIIDAREYPERKQLWQSLPRKMQYQTFKRILDYLEASGQIAFVGTKIIYSGANNSKLKALIESSIKIR